MTELEKQDCLIDRISFMLKFLPVDDPIKTWDWLATEFFEEFRGEPNPDDLVGSQRTP